MNANQKLSWAYLLLSGLLVMLTPPLPVSQRPAVGGGHLRLLGRGLPGDGLDCQEPMTHPLIQQIHDAREVVQQSGNEPWLLEVSSLRFSRLCEILDSGGQEASALRCEYLGKGEFLGLKLKIVKGHGMAVSGRRKK